jgi:glycosyltransferase involved in cell wall biosynthesis
LKVLHVNDYRRLGGCEVVVERTVELLRARGIDADVFTSEDVAGLRRAPLGYIDSGRARRALAARLRTSVPDVVHLHNFYHLLSPGILAALGAHRRDRALRVVMTAHDYHLVSPNAAMFFTRGGTIHPAEPRRLGSLRYLLTHRWDRRGAAHSLLKLAQHLWNYRILARREVLDCVLCPSRSLQQTLAAFGLPAVHLPLPVPALTRIHGRPTGKLTLVFAGRIEPEKGLAELLERLPAGFPGRLIVLGDGSELERCRSICRERGLERVEFRGWCPRDEVLATLASAHVLVLPSLGVENQPLAVLEALAAGTNVLVSDVGGMSEIVEEAGVGFTFDPDAERGVGEAIGRVVDAFEGGTLNDFDVTAFLEERDERTYVNRLIGAYQPSLPQAVEVQGRAAVTSG